MFHALAKILAKKGYSTAVGDEGGFAPNLKSNEEACELIVAAIEAAGYKPGEDAVIALDPAAISFFENGAYELGKSGLGTRTAEEMIAIYDKWIAAYPIASIEDGLAENDWAGFAHQTARQGGRIQIVGDDLFVTNVDFVRRGIAEKSANAVLIKLNQIGTVSETVKTIALCRAAGWAYVVSHRSGETEDAFMADFAVAMGGGQIKTGSACRSERIAKYNRLLEIEAELGAAAEFRSPFIWPAGRAETRWSAADSDEFENRSGADFKIREHRKRRALSQMPAPVEFRAGAAHLSGDLCQWVILAICWCSSAPASGASCATASISAPPAFSASAFPTAPSRST